MRILKNVPAKEIEARTQEILGKQPRVLPLENHEIAPDWIEQLRPPKGYGNPDNPDELPEGFRTVLRNEALFKVSRPMGGFFITQSKMPPRDREIMILRGAWHAQAPYEWGEHVQIGHRCGISTEEIEAIIEGPDAPNWSRHDRALILAVDELMTNAMMSEETWDTIAETFDASLMLEVPSLIGTYLGTAFLQNSVRYRLREGNEGLKAR